MVRGFRPIPFEKPMQRHIPPSHSPLGKTPHNAELGITGQFLPDLMWWRGKPIKEHARSFCINESGDFKRFS
jgi:hypothetical protein